MRNLKAGNYYDYGPYGEVGGEERDPRFRDAEAAGRYGPAQRVRFTNFSGWDVYRSQMALVGLLAPAVAGDMAQSLVHTGVEWRNKKPTEENGILEERSFQGRDIPRWTAGEKEWGVMSGDPGPPSVSSLYFFSQGNLRSLPITLDVFDYSSRWVRVHSDARRSTQCLPSCQQSDGRYGRGRSHLSVCVPSFADARLARGAQTAGLGVVSFFA